MGNSQSFEITPQEPHDAEAGKKAANGHGISNLDQTDAVSCEVSEQPPATLTNEEPPATLTNNQKPMPKLAEPKNTIGESLEANTNQVTAIVDSSEQNNPAVTSDLAKKEAQKTAETGTIFNKMFKKKNEPISDTTDVSCELSLEQNTDPVSMTGSVDAKSAQILVEADEISIPAKDEIPVEKSSIFNKMFKKKTEPILPAPEITEVLGQQNSEPAVCTDNNNLKTSQESTVTISSETSNTVKDEATKPAEKVKLFGNVFKKKIESAPSETDINGTVICEPIHDLSEATSTIDVKNSNTTVIFELKTTEEEQPQLAKKPTIFKMFKKKNEPASPTLEVNGDVSEKQNTELSTLTVAVNTNPAAELMKPDSTSSKDKKKPDKEESPKPAEKSNRFKMFKKNKPESESTLESLDVNATIPTDETVSLHSNINDNNDTPVSSEEQSIADTSMPDKDEAPKPVEKPSIFNKMFKKKNEAVLPTPEINGEVLEKQHTEPSPLTININGNPTVEMMAPDSTSSTEQKKPDKDDAPKQAEKSKRFGKMFSKKINEPLSPKPESEPAIESLDVNVTISSDKSVYLQTNGNDVSDTTVSSELMTTETILPDKEEAPKLVKKPTIFNMFKKKNEPMSPTLEVNCDVLEKENIEQLPEIVSINANPTAELFKPDSALSLETNIPDKEETPKPAEKSSRFNKMFKKNKPESEPTLECLDVNDTISSDKTVSLQANINDTGDTVEEKITPETSMPDKEEAPKPVEKSSIFNKMFKKKNELVSPTPEVNGEVADKQIGKTSALTVTINANPTAEIMEPDSTSLTEQKKPDKENVPKSAEKSNRFGKMFKKSNEPAPVISESEPILESLDFNGTKSSDDAASLHANINNVSETTTSSEQLTSETSLPAKGEAPKLVKKPTLFNMFKKKNEPAEETVPEVQTNGAESELPDIRASAQAEKDPQGEPLEPSTSEVASENAQVTKADEEERPVMNFFKTLRVTPTKPTKQTTPNPDTSKDQAQDVSKVPPPPPPPAPPKMENKAEPAVKKEDAQQAAAPKAKETENSSKTKAKESTFGKLFRSKSVVKEEAKPVEVQVDASKASTLEATAKPEPPPPPKPEEKKPEKKSSAFASLLKPKELLNQMSSKIQAAASSASSIITISTRGAATEPKKESPATHAAAPEAASSTKVKEEPKPAAAQAAAAASLDDKSVESADNSSPNTPRRLEKRNSIQLFFKNLGQKRHSDAGVQTEPAAPEKAK